MKKKAKTKTSGTVKVTALLPRGLWARVRAEAVRRNTTARDLLTKAVDTAAKSWDSLETWDRLEKEEKR
jgi:hypothetical protein